MNLSPVARLKKTWSKVKTAKFDVLEVGTPPALLDVEVGSEGLPAHFAPHLELSAHSAPWGWVRLAGLAWLPSGGV